MALPILESPQVTATYDVEQDVALVVYKDTLTPTVTSMVYGWFDTILSTVGVENIRGGVLDFRQVTEFDKGNLPSVHRESRNVNMKYDLSSIPIALVVQTVQQAQAVGVTMQMTPQQERKKIVRSIEEALAFIAQFYPVRK